MTYSIRWYVLSRIIYMDLEDDITIEKLTNINHDLMLLLDEGTAPIHLIVNESKVTKMPVQLRQIQAKLEFMRHPSLGWAVGIGEVNPLVKYLIPMVAKVIGTNLVRRNTMESALEFLSSQDPSLKDILSSTTPNPL